MAEEKHDMSLLKQAANFVRAHLAEEADNRLTFHSFLHTEETASAAKEIAEGSNVSADDLRRILLAAWFHDVGYVKQYENHEEASKELAKEFMEQHQLPTEDQQAVLDLIEATRWGKTPDTLPEKILVDADMVSIGKKRFFTRAELLRLEWEAYCDKVYTDEEWEELQLRFLMRTQFHTPYARQNFGKRRMKNIAEQRQRFAKAETKADKLRSKKNKKKKYQRGVETMYRAAYRNHINLSSIADAKANMMISINTIIVSIIITALGSGFSFSDDYLLAHRRFTIPLGILLFGSLASVVFAILSASPSVTSKKVNHKKIKNNKSSILFFGNFTNMALDEFVDEMAFLRNRTERLYDNMSVDLYALGNVLTRKYRLLNISYTLFMIALILTVLTFALIFVLSI